MGLNILATSLLMATAFVAAEPAPYKLGSMSLNRALGLGRRQDAGYSPTQTYCGPGSDCATSCGATYIQCASSDDALHCYDPSVKESCCTDESGNSCEDGYFCTSDTSGGTWCCPDGMDLVSCAAAYSLTDVLVSEKPTAAPTTIPLYTPVSVSVEETPSYTPSYVHSYKPSYTPSYTQSYPHTYDHSSYEHSYILSTTITGTYTSSSYSNSSSSTYTITPAIVQTTFPATPLANVTASQTTTTGFTQFTGGANSQVVRDGLKGLAVVAGVVLAL